MKIILAFLAGVLLTSAVFVWLVLPRNTHIAFEHGFSDGTFCGKEDVFESIAEQFPHGLSDDIASYRQLFQVGRGTVVVIESDGVKTLKVLFPEKT